MLQAENPMHIAGLPKYLYRTSLALNLLPVMKLLYNLRVRNNFDIRNKYGKENKSLNVTFSENWENLKPVPLENMQLRQHELTFHVFLDQNISSSHKHSVIILNGMPKGMQFQTLISRNSKSR